jgi:uroporphyrinogen decarboxylase
MNSRDRCLASLQHREPDRVPFDLAGSAQTGIHLTAYADLRRYLDLPDQEPQLRNLIGQIAEPEEDLLDRLRVDTRLIPQGNPLPWRTLRDGNPDGASLLDEGDSWALSDEWGIGWRMPKEGGFYFDMVRHPLDGDDVAERARKYLWPDPLVSRRFEGLRERIQGARRMEKLVVLNGPCAGILEVYSWLRGYLRFYVDLVESPRTVETFLDKLLEFKSAFWRRALGEFGDAVDVVNEADDMAGQNGLLLSGRLSPPDQTPPCEPLCGHQESGSPGQDLLPLLRGHPPAHPGSHRGGGRHPQPRPDQRQGNEPL